MRNKLILDTYSDVTNFFNIVSSLPNERIELVSDDNRYRVNAKSYLSCLLAHTEWGAKGIWIETDNDLYELFKDFINTSADDGAFIHE